MRRPLLHHARIWPLAASEQLRRLPGGERRAVIEHDVDPDELLENGQGDPGPDQRADAAGVFVDEVGIRC